MSGLAWPGVVFTPWSRSGRVVSGTVVSSCDGLQGVGQAGGMFPGQNIALEYSGSEKRQKSRGKKTFKTEDMVDLKAKIDTLDGVLS